MTVYVSLITLGVEDLERSTRFYEAMSWELSTESVPGVVSFLRGGATTLGLFGRDALSEDAAGTPLAAPPAAVSLATNVSSPDVVDAVLEAAERAGGRVVKPGQTAEWGGYSGYFADPDGHLWEVAHNAGWDLAADGRVRLEHDPEHAAGSRDPLAALRDFRAGVDARGGRPSAELADEAADIVRRAHDELGELLAGLGNDAVIAVMSLLSERGMEAPPASRASAVEHAASGLVGSFLAPGGD